MYKVTCNNCGEDATFETPSELPEQCDNCYNSFVGTQYSKVEDKNAQDEIASQRKSPGGFCMVCQKTGRKVEIGHDDLIILGRDASGSDVLTDSHISGKHCKIEYNEGVYRISDDGSTNGTFIGAARIDCKANPNQEMKDNELVYLGEEPFLIQLRYLDLDRPLASDQKPAEDNIGTTETVHEKTTVYRCLDCGKEDGTNDDVCSCGAYARWVKIEK